MENNILHRCNLFSLAAVCLMLFTGPKASAVGFVDTFKDSQAFDQGYLSALHTFKANKALLPQAVARLKPRVDATFDQNWFQVSDRNSNHNYGLTITQPFNISSYYEYKASQHVDINAKNVFDSATQGLIFDVIDKYIQFFRQRDVLDMARAELTLVNTHRGQLRQQFLLGAIAQSAWTDTLALQKQTALSLLQAEDEYHKAIVFLRMLTKEVPDSVAGFVANTFPLIPLSPLTLGEWLTLAGDNNLDIRMAEQSAKRAFYIYKTTDSNKYPTASLNASHFQHYNANGLGQSGNTTNFSLNMSSKIFDFGLNDAQTMVDKETWNALKSDREHALSYVKNQVTVRHHFSQTSLELITHLNELLELKQLALGAMKKEQLIGRLNLANVLSFERQIFSIRRHLSTAHFDHVLNTANIKKVSGILGEDDLAQFDRWLN